MKTTKKTIEQSNDEIIETLTKEVEEDIKKTPSKKIEEIYFTYASTKDPVIRNEIVTMNQPLVAFIINKYYNRSRKPQLIREDLFQEGIIGLIAAIEGYKPEFGFRFSTYATWWIRQAINNYILNVEPMIHVPSHVRTANNKLLKKMKSENLVFQDLLDNYQDGEISEKMIKSISCALKSRNISSLDEPVRSATGEVNTTLQDIIPGTDPNCDLIMDKSMMIKFAKKALTELSEKERYILLLRFDVINSVPLNTNSKKR